MNNHIKLSSLALALALSTGVALNASAQSSGGGAAGGGAAGGGVTSSDPTGMAKDSFPGWMRDYSQKNQRISRQAYMDEAARRWDSMDTTKQGLTYDQVSRMYGYSATGMGGPTATRPQEKKGIQR